MSQPAAVVVFDFDLTLTRWDTAERFSGGYSNGMFGGSV
jgi:hypothetical protein